MSKFLNPCSHLIINDNYPFAKIRRSDISVRFWDTFETINGKFTNDNKQEAHLGVLDYLVFPILVPLGYYFKDKQKSLGSDVITRIKAPFSFIITCVVSPFVLFTNVVRSFINSKEDRKCKLLDVTTDVETIERNFTAIPDSAKEEHLENQTIITENYKEVVTKKQEKQKSLQIFNKKNFGCTENPRLKDTKFIIQKGEDDQPYVEAQLRGYPVQKGGMFPLYRAYGSYSYPKTFSNVKIFASESNKSAISWMLKSNYKNIITNSLPENIEKLAAIVDTTSFIKA